MGALASILGLGGTMRQTVLLRALANFNRLMMSLRADDLSPADRVVLHALLRDLVLLTRYYPYNLGRQNHCCFVTKLSRYQAP